MQRIYKGAKHKQLKTECCIPNQGHAPPIILYVVFRPHSLEQNMNIYNSV